MNMSTKQRIIHSAYNIGRVVRYSPSFFIAIFLQVAQFLWAGQPANFSCSAVNVLLYTMNPDGADMYTNNSGPLLS